MGIFSNLNLLFFNTQKISTINESENNAYKFMDDLVFKKTDHSYEFQNKNGSVVSKLNYYDYKIDNFDWILIANVHTKPDYRRKGLAEKLINELYSDISKLNKGVYLFVKPDNQNAINLYRKLKFHTIKRYTLKDGEYIIMAKGNANKSQFNEMKFAD